MFNEPFRQFIQWLGIPFEHNAPTAVSYDALREVTQSTSRVSHSAEREESWTSMS